MATIFAAATGMTAAAPAGGRGQRLAPPAPPLAVGFATRRAAVRGLRLARRASGPSTPPEISEKVQESIKHAEEACAGDPESGECAAAWDEVEELSAAASHKRDQMKSTDPLEEFCKDNPETEYCRTYDS